MNLFKLNIFKSISTGYIVFIITNIIALFLTPYILKYVGKVEFGLYILCIDLFTWISFLQFGTAKVLGPLVAIERTNNNNKRIISLFNSSFIFQFLMAILIIPIFYFIANYSAVDKSNLPKNTTLLLILFAIASGIQVLKQQLSEMLIAAKQMHVDNKLNLLFTILRFVLILIFIPYFGLTTIFIVYLFIAILNFLRAYVRTKKVYPFLKIRFSLFDKNEFKNLLSDGVYFTLASISTILILKFDNFFLGRKFGLEFVSKLYITIRLLLIGQKIIEILFNNFRPYISSFKGSKDDNKIKLFYRVSVKLNFIMASIGISTILLINKFFIKWWVGEDFYLGDKIAIFYGVFYLTYIISQPVRIIMVSTLTKIKNASIARFIEGVIRIGVLYSLFHYVGLKLLPISSFILSAIFQYLYITYLISKDKNWNTKKELINAFLFLLLPTAITLGLFYFETKIILWTFAVASLLISISIVYFQKEQIITIIKSIKKK